MKASLQGSDVRRRVRQVVRALEQFLGTPRQESLLPPPLDMLIATILSQNTNDKNSHRAYTSLRSQYPTWESVAHAPLRGIIAAIRQGGMANQKSRRIRETLLAVKEQYGDYDLSALRSLSNENVIDDLVRLRGVGPKTASCVLLFSLGRDLFPVDTHVHRICGRLGLSGASRSPEETFRIMKPLIPKGKGYSFHTNLIRFGRKVCRSHSPACGVCPVRHLCSYPKKSRPGRAAGVLSRADHDFMLLDNVRPAR